MSGQATVWKSQAEVTLGASKEKLLQLKWADFWEMNWRLKAAATNDMVAKDVRVDVRLNVQAMRQMVKERNYTGLTNVFSKDALTWVVPLDNYDRQMLVITDEWQSLRADLAVRLAQDAEELPLLGGLFSKSVAVDDGHGKTYVNQIMPKYQILDFRFPGDVPRIVAASEG